MKLLFDQNLSRHLVAAFGDLYPHSSHVALVGLAQASDTAVWRHAGAHDFVLVSKDADFHQLSLVHGAPPKVIWIRRGNVSTAAIATLLRAHSADVEAFIDDVDATFLALG